MTTLYERLTSIEDLNQIEYVDSLKDKWMCLREDESNIEDMKRLIIFSCNLLIDIVAENNPGIAMSLEEDLECLKEMIEEVKKVDELESIVELHIQDVLMILSKI